ncbi:hypothetical protein [Singulisphaera acidiphila]|nr:hypothetical protein [Singulisphaera acidiphila]
MLLVLLWPVLVIGGEPTAGEKAAAVIPDPDYVPKVGDRAVLYSLDSEKIPFDLWCASTSPDCRNFIKSMLAPDDENQAAGDPAAEAKLVHLAPKTDVQLLAVETVEVAGAKEGPPLKCTYFAIKVLAGPFQGQTLYTLDFHITRLIPPPAPLGVGAETEAPKTLAAAPAPAPTRIELEIVDAPASPREKTKGPETPALVSAPTPIERETTDIPVTNQERGKLPLAPARIERETTAKPGRATASGAPAIATQAPRPEASSPARPVAFASTAPVILDTSSPSAPSPSLLPRADVVTRESSQPASPAPGDASTSQRTGIGGPQPARRSLPNPARALVSAPTKPLSAPELLTMAQERDAAGKAVEALVAYRTLERTHPGSQETRIAVGRIKGLTERLEVDAQEVRAGLLMKQARTIEASGNRELASGYFQQIVRVYPKTPTARLAAERIKTMGTSRPTPAPAP